MIGIGSVRLTAHASRLLAHGQVWFYRDDLAEAAASPGDLVRVFDSRGREAALAFYSAASRIAVRLCSGRAASADLRPAEFLGTRLVAAVARRAEFDPRAGVRLVHGEADGLPGLVVDRYADVLVLQVTTPTIEAAYDLVVEPLLAACGGAAIAAVWARNDLKVRQLEGLPAEVRLLHGRRVEEVEIDEGGVRHRVDVVAGHKTGFYLDQRRARARVAELAAGRRMLDLFAYQGGFALAALRGGASAALAVDQSETALQRAAAGAAANNLSGLAVRAGNAFDVVRELRAAAAAYDLVVLDPPAFAKSRRELSGAERGYRDLNGLALRLLAPGGLLVTCSCSQHVKLPAFEGLVRQAAAGLPFKVVLRERIMADRDHPVWVDLPQSEYLKVLLLERID